MGWRGFCIGTSIFASLFWGGAALTQESAIAGRTKDVEPVQASASSVADTSEWPAPAPLPPGPDLGYVGAAGQIETDPDSRQSVASPAERATPASGPRQPIPVAAGGECASCTSPCAGCDLRPWGELPTLHCGHGWFDMDIGGEYRMRYHAERNHRGLGLTGVDDDFLLHRTLLHADVRLGERFRVYAEMIDAVSNYENFAPRPIEEDRTDLLNLYADFKVLAHRCGDLQVRVGRQDLLYGAQRTVSPLDWANTRRTFEGYKAFWRGANWDADAFWVRPVIPFADRFDSPDQRREFMGFYLTNKQLPNQIVDLYYLRLVQTDLPINFDFDTLGARWKGSRDAWLWEVEAAVQLGDFGSEDHLAGAFTLGAGRRLKSLPWEPELWFYYDWASGDETIGNGYDHLFPLSHKYLGFMDLFGRRNIEDINFLLTAKPHKKVKLLLWWHILNLQDRDDVPYSVAMTPLVLTPGGSAQLGQEIDLTASWDMSQRVNLLVGYSHFFAGAFFRTNPSPPRYDGDADFIYTQLSLRF